MGQSLEVLSTKLSMIPVPGRAAPPLEPAARPANTSASKLPSSEAESRECAPRSTFGISLDVDHADLPNRRGRAGWGAAQITSGVPDMTLTCTSIPR